MPHYLLNDEELTIAHSLIEQAFLEDLSDSEDLTTNSLVPNDASGSIQIVAREDGILCGISIARSAFQIFDPEVDFEIEIEDGDHLSPGSVIAEINGAMRSILTVERTALNFLTMLSGISTLTARFVEKINNDKAEILDTRKTLPGLRCLQKYAVRCGGGKNHRMGLYDAVLIKDNHLAWLTQDKNNRLNESIEKARAYSPLAVIEIEVDTLEQLREVLQSDPDIVLLDNMPENQLREAISLRNQLAPKVLLEASGGINLDTVAGVASTGVDRISVGALTHSAVALDIGFDWYASH